ncbi:hypothetical protein YC2023_028350 [Brassica napus]
MKSKGTVQIVAQSQQFHVQAGKAVYTSPETGRTGDEVGTLWDQYAVDEFYKDDMSWLEDDALIGSDKLQYYGTYVPFSEITEPAWAFAVEAEAPQETLATK